MNAHKMNRYLFFLALLIIIQGCSVSSRSMKTPNYHIEFYKNDFEYSQQVSAEATSVRILGIDWQRFLNWETGSISSDRFRDESQNLMVSGNIVADPVVGVVSAIIPVVGDYGKGKVSAYALHRLMLENPGYDVVIYPQYETQRFFVPFIYSKRKVTVTARLGKIK